MTSAVISVGSRCRIHHTAHHPEVTQLVCEALYMAKAMNRRLRHYKRDWDNGLWMPESAPHLAEGGEGEH